MTEKLEFDIAIELLHIENEVKDKIADLYGMRDFEELREFILDHGSFNENDYEKIRNSFNSAIENILALIVHKIHPLEFAQCLKKIEEYREFAELFLNTKTKISFSIKDKLIHFIKMYGPIRILSSPDFAEADKRKKIELLRKSGWHDKSSNEDEALNRLENGLRSVLLLLATETAKKFKSIQPILDQAPETCKMFAGELGIFHTDKPFEDEVISEIDKADKNSKEFKKYQPSIHGLLSQSIYKCLNKITALDEIETNATQEIMEKKTNRPASVTKISETEFIENRIKETNELNDKARKKIVELILRTLHKKWKPLPSTDIKPWESAKLEKLRKEFETKIVNHSISPKDVEVVIAECISQLGIFEQSKLFKTSEYDDWLRDELMFGPHADFGASIKGEDFNLALDITTGSGKDADKKFGKIVALNPTTLKNLPEGDPDFNAKDMFITLMLSVKITSIEELINITAQHIIFKLKKSNMPLNEIIDLKDLHINQICLPRRIAFSPIINHMIDQINYIERDFFTNPETIENFQAVFRSRKRYSLKSFQEKLNTLRSILIETSERLVNEENEETTMPLIYLKPSYDLTSYDSIENQRLLS